MVYYFFPNENCIYDKKNVLLKQPENCALVECSMHAGYFITCNGQFIST